MRVISVFGVSIHRQLHGAVTASAEDVRSAQVLGWQPDVRSIDHRADGPHGFTVKPAESGLTVLQRQEPGVATLP